MNRRIVLLVSCISLPAAYGIVMVFERLMYLIMGLDSTIVGFPIPYYIRTGSSPPFDSIAIKIVDIAIFYITLTYIGYWLVPKKFREE